MPTGTINIAAVMLCSGSALIIPHAVTIIPTSDKELKLGNYAAAFNLSTKSIASDIEDTKAMESVKKLQEETFKTLRLLENEIISLSHK